MLIPVGAEFKLLLQVAPRIPEVVHHSPHVGLVAAVVGFGERCGSRAHAEYYLAAALVDGVSQHHHLAVVVWSAQVVHLQEVDAPLCIHIDDGVVILLCAGFCAIDAVVVVEPCAECVGLAYLVAGVGCAEYGAFVVHCHLWHSAHDMYAPFEAHGVERVADGLESDVLAILHHRWESFGIGQIAPVFIVCVFGVGLVVPPSGIVGIPSDVDDDILPSAVEQIVAHVFCILHHLAFGHCRCVAVP